MLPSRPSAPLAACGLLLFGLGALGLARAPRRPEPVREPRAVPAPSEAAEPLVRGGRIDLNEASAADLELLPRIGPTLARRVVTDRERNGPFAAIEDLARVRGIGPRTLERLRPLVRVEVPRSVTRRSP